MKHYLMQYLISKSKKVMNIEFISLFIKEMLDYELE